MPPEGIPLHFQLMEPALAEKAVEGIPYILQDEHTKAEALYRQHTECRNGCGHTMEKAFGGTGFAFAPGFSWEQEFGLNRSAATLSV